MVFYRKYIKRKGFIIQIPLGILNIKEDLNPLGDTDYFILFYTSMVSNKSRCG